MHLSLVSWCNLPGGAGARCSAAPVRGAKRQGTWRRAAGNTQLRQQHEQAACSWRRAAPGGCQTCLVVGLLRECRLRPPAAATGAGVSVVRVAWIASKKAVSCHAPPWLCCPAPASVVPMPRLNVFGGQHRGAARRWSGFRPPRSAGAVAPAQHRELRGGCVRSPLVSCPICSRRLVAPRSRPATAPPAGCYPPPAPTQRVRLRARARNGPSTTVLPVHARWGP
mmetsp:Transcript_16046/g.60681  ORF Transcript_16046/g.60681 Transcript_16046/m.60681 type:complete len:224 (-) Transcript_16046:706-1377(-)